MSRTIQIFTDGSASNKTGIGGYGIVMMDFSDTSEITSNGFSSFRAKITQYAGGSYYSTNSARMEMKGMIESLKKCLPGDSVTVWMDCQWIVNSVAKGWVFKWEENVFQTYNAEIGEFVPRNNTDLWKEFLVEYRRLKKRVKLKWLKGHQEIADANYYNHVADQLAFKGSQRKTKIKDNYEKLSNKKGQTLLGESE